MSHLGEKEVVVHQPHKSLPSGRVPQQLRLVFVERADLQGPMREQLYALRHHVLHISDLRQHPVTNNISEGRLRYTVPHNVKAIAVVFISTSCCRTTAHPIGAHGVRAAF